MNRAARERVDLLTVDSHELGHRLGLDDLDPALAVDDAMSAILGTGARRRPWSEAVDALFGS